MDDFLLFSNSKSALKEKKSEIEEFCKQQLHLALKPYVLGSCKNGVSFLGYLIKPDMVSLSQKSRKRKRTKLKKLNYELSLGTIDEEKYIARAKCLCMGFLHV